MVEKKLTIIIPHYQEPKEDVFPLLASIGMQVGINLEEIICYIINDGPNATPLGEVFLKFFNFEIQEYTAPENKGPGVTRQYGLDLAQTKYVMFCDADDSLHSCGVLDSMIQTMDEKECDYMRTKWLEEVWSEKLGRVKYVTHENENTWMHGKMFRRDFLVENNIRFHSDYWVHEDSYFLCIAAAAAKKTIGSGITSYVWKHHEGSITRKNEAAYSFNSIPTFLEACCAAHAIIAKINPGQINYKTVQLSCYIYFMMQSKKWNLPENLEYKKNAEQAFVKYMKPFWGYWNAAGEKFRAEIYNQERKKHADKTFIEKETLDEWINRLGMNVLGVINVPVKKKEEKEVK